MPRRPPRMHVPAELVAQPGEGGTLPIDEVIMELRAWAREQPKDRYYMAPQNLVSTLIGYAIEYENQALADWQVKGEIARMLGIPAGSEIDMTILRDAIKRRLQKGEWP